jgi:hypothetical protein
LRRSGKAILVPAPRQARILEMLTPGANEQTTAAR